MANIRRQRRIDPYERIDRGLLQDPDLSWETAGLLAYALSLPDDWKLTTTHLIKFRNAGKDKIWRMLREGQEAGYIVRVQYRRPNGTFFWEYVVCEFKQDTERVRREAEAR